MQVFFLISIHKAISYELWNHISDVFCQGRRIVGEIIQQVVIYIQLDSVVGTSRIHLTPNTLVIVVSSTSIFAIFFFSRNAIFPFLNNGNLTIGIVYRWKVYMYWLYYRQYFSIFWNATIMLRLGL